MKKYNLYLFFTLILFTYISSTPNLVFDGSDIVNPYRYYVELTKGASFLDYVQIYDGREYELILPTVIALLSKISKNLTINEFAWIISLFINILNVIAFQEIIRKYYKNIASRNIYLIMFIFIIFNDYGIIQQLLRQSLSISIFLIAISRTNRFCLIFYLVLSVFTHYASILLVLFYIIFCKYGVRWKKQILSMFFLIPYLIFSQGIIEHITVNESMNFGELIGKRDQLIFIILIVTTIINFFYIKLKTHENKFEYFYLWNYFFFLIFYTINSTGALFQRVFLISQIVNIFIISKLLNKYELINRKNLTPFIHVTLMMTKLIQVYFNANYFIIFPFLN